MATILNEIGFFQFDNLIRNRIPFVLVNLGVDLQGFYKMPLYQNHLNGITVKATATEVSGILKNRNHPTHEAILVIAPENAQAIQLVDQLEGEGYANVFYVKDGVEGLKTDASR